MDGKMKIASKILLGFSVIAVLSVIIAISSLSAASEINSRLSDPLTDLNSYMPFAIESSSFAKRAEGHLFMYFVLSDPNDKQKFFDRQSFLQEQVNFLKTIPDDEILVHVSLLQKSTDDLLEYGNKLVTLHAENHKSLHFPENKDIVLGFHDSSSVARSEGVVIAELITKNIAQERSNSSMYAQSMMSTLTTGVFLLLLVIVVVALWIVKIVKDTVNLEQINSSEKRFAILGELTARLSHDLRNPLAVIQGVSALYLKKPSTDETELSKRNDMMIKSIRRMTNQIDDVLSFVKQPKLQLTDSSLLKCIENTCSEVILPENIKLNLPSNDFTLSIDTQKIEIAFINIIRNAIESIGNEPGEINIELSESNTDILASFTNSGSDIPDHNLEKIFEPLFTTKETGTGLGLISSKVIVESHGGSIHVKNNPTCFTIRLPKTSKL